MLRSDDLVHWEPAGHAIASVPGHEASPRPGHGVWAPAIRAHDDGVRITWGDPDTGIWMVRADTPAGPWDAPVLVLAGRGLIDPCPFSDADGREWMVHGWAHSRAGIANRLDLLELSVDGTTVIGAPRVLIDGNDIDGCTVLEGPSSTARGATTGCSRRRRRRHRLAVRLSGEDAERTVGAPSHPLPRRNGRERPPPGRLGAHGGR